MTPRRLGISSGPRPSLDNRDNESAGAINRFSCRESKNVARRPPVAGAENACRLLGPSNWRF